MKKENPYLHEKMGFWRRLGWILTYYRLPILAVTACLVVVGYIIYLNVRPDRTDILNVMIVNGNVAAESDLFDRYLEQAGFDITENEAYISNAIPINFDGTDEKAWDYFQVVTAQFLTGEIDLYLSDGDVFSRFANYGAFMEVTEFLTEEQLKLHEDDILYIPNSETGELMACGIILPQGTEICDVYFFDTCYLGLSANVFNDIEAYAVMDLILEQLP